MTVLQKLGQINANLEMTSRSKDFAEYAVALLRAGGDPQVALHDADANQVPQRVRTVLKAATAGSLSDDGYTPLRILAEGFSSTLTNAAFDACLADAHIAPLHVRFAVTAIDATAGAVSEGAAKRVSSISFVGATLAARMAATIVAVSEDLLRFQSAVGLIENSLRNGVARAVDSTFLSTLISGTTPIAASGTSAAAALHDIRVLLDAATVTASSRFHLIASPATVARLAVMTTATVDGLAFPDLTVNGGSVGGIAVHASDVLTNTAVLVDAAQLVAGADPVTISVSQNASLQMDSVPTQTIASGSPAAPVASTVVSMFQTNSSAIRCERRFGFSLLRASAVQSLSGVAWAT